MTRRRGPTLKALSEAQLRRAAKANDEGVTYVALAPRFGVSVEYLRKLVVEYRQQVESHAGR